MCRANGCGPLLWPATDSPEVSMRFSTGIRIAKLFSKAPADWKSHGQTTSAQLRGLRRFILHDILLEYRFSSSLAEKGLSPHAVREVFEIAEA